MLHILGFVLVTLISNPAGLIVEYSKSGVLDTMGCGPVLKQRFDTNWTFPLLSSGHLQLRCIDDGLVLTAKSG